MTGFILRVLICAAGLWVATHWAVPGAYVDSNTTLFIAALVLGVVNAIVRPIAFILTLPVTILTLGLFLFVLNAAMVGLVAWLVPGFHAGGFRGALLTAIIVWIVGWIASWFIGKRGIERYARR